MKNYIDTPLNNDIICGQDKTYGSRPGNRAYRQLIEMNALGYSLDGLTKHMKMAITKQIVDQLEEEGARFIRKSGDQWEALSKQQARDKTSHALRFCAASLRRKKSLSLSALHQFNADETAKRRREEITDAVINIIKRQEQDSPSVAVRENENVGS